MHYIFLVILVRATCVVSMCIRMCRITNFMVVCSNLVRLLLVSRLVALFIIRIIVVPYASFCLMIRVRHGINVVIRDMMITVNNRIMSLIIFRIRPIRLRLLVLLLPPLPLPSSFLHLLLLLSLGRSSVWAVGGSGGRQVGRAIGGGRWVDRAGRRSCAVVV